MGEAPINLSSYDNYRKNKLYKKNISVYVDLMTGVVDVCKGLQVPLNCVKIGLATGGHSSLENGVPYFQGTKGVCATITVPGATDADTCMLAIYCIL